MKTEYIVRLKEIKNNEFGNSGKSKTVFGLNREDYETTGAGFSREIEKIVIKTYKHQSLDRIKDIRSQLKNWSSYVTSIFIQKR